MRRGHVIIKVGQTDVWEQDQQATGNDRRTIDERLITVVHRPAPDVEWVPRAGRGANGLQRDVEPVMEFVEVAGGGGIGDLGGCAHATAPIRSTVARSARPNRCTMRSISSSVTMNGGASMARSPLTPSARPTLGHTTTPGSSAPAAKGSAKRAGRG